MAVLWRIVARSFLVCVLAHALCAVVPLAARASTEESTVTDPQVAGPAQAEPAQWRSKVQQVFDVRTRTLERRLYTVWDPEPSKGRDFTWSPDDPVTAEPGRISGPGKLTWRLAGQPSYDTEANVVQMSGTFVDGKVSVTA